MAWHEIDGLIGFVRYNIRPPGDAGWALGTWVHPKWRCKGMALQLWDAVLTSNRWDTFHVGTVSRAGRRFAKALASRHPEIDWDLETLS
jgi:hypothetical protein